MRLYMSLLLVAGLVGASLAAAGCVSMNERRRAEREFKAQIEAYNAKVDNPDDKIVCKKITMTGSRIPERVCRTRREWRGDHEQAQDMMQRLRQRGGGDRPRD